MPVAAPATPARKRLERFPSRPLLPWLFALQGANRNLSAFSIGRLDAARISRDPSKKSPCTSCIPAASGLAFRSPGCEPKPVRFFNRPSGCRSHLPRPQREIAVHDLHPSRIWLGFSPSRVRTKTCPLFQPPVWMPLASPATPARNRRARLASQPHLAWLFALQDANQHMPALSIARLDAARISRDPSEKSPCTTCIPAASGLGFRSPGCEPKPVRFFNRPSGCRSHPPRPQQEITMHVLHPSRIWLGFSPSRTRTNTCPLYQSP